MATLIITEKTSQAKDLAAALGSRYGKILPAEGHLLRLAEPDEIDPAWRRWSCTLLKPDGLYPTRPASGADAHRDANAFGGRSRNAPGKLARKVLCNLGIKPRKRRFLFTKRTATVLLKR
jgi:DNA topoisomerase IA